MRPPRPSAVQHQQIESCDMLHQSINSCIVQAGSLWATPRHTHRLGTLAQPVVSTRVELFCGSAISSFRHLSTCITHFTSLLMIVLQMSGDRDGLTTAVMQLRDMPCPKMQSNRLAPCPHHGQAANLDRISFSMLPLPSDGVSLLHAKRPPMPHFAALIPYSKS